MKKMTVFLASTFALLTSQLLIAQTPTPNTYYSESRSGQNNVSNRINWLSDYSQAVSLSQSSSKPIAILFTGTGWCPACMQLERNVITRPEFSEAVSARFVFLKAEFPDYSESSVRNSPYKPLMDRYAVNAFPTIVVVNPNGQQLFTVNYKAGGPQVYAQEMLQKLSQVQPGNLR